MASVQSAANKLDTNEVDFNSPVSESLANRMAGSINYVLDRNSTILELDGSGWHRISSLNDLQAYHYIRKNSKINTYVLTNQINGSSGAIAVNAKVYDASGVLLGDLFSVAPSIDSAIAASQAENRFTIGRLVEENTDIESGTNKVAGALNYTELDAGFKLRFYAESVMVDGASYRFKLWLREID